MNIIYDSIEEFGKILIACNDTRRKGKCMFCPFYADDCQIDDFENTHIMCGQIIDRLECEVKE